MWANDRQRLGAVETDELYNNAIHSAMECVLLVFLDKEWDKALQRKLRLMEGEKNLHLEEWWQLKAWVHEVEGLIKETLESVDKFQDLDEANSTKANLET